MNIFGSLGKLAQIALAVASLFPVAIEAVKGAETALGPGTGSAKLALVEGVLQATYATVQTVETTWTDIAPAIRAVVNSIVAALNAARATAPTVTPAA